MSEEVDQIRVIFKCYKEFQVLGKGTVYCEQYIIREDSKVILWKKS